MIIVYNVSTNLDWVNAATIESLQGLKVSNGQINGGNGFPTVYANESQEDAIARFDDLLEALAADQKIYDTRKDVGYWKPKKKTPGRKPAAEKSHSEQSQPAPKK